jgi:hypothetical protein
MDVSFEERGQNTCRYSFSDQDDKNAAAIELAETGRSPLVSHCDYLSVMANPEREDLSVENCDVVPRAMG